MDRMLTIAQAASAAARAEALGQRVEFDREALAALVDAELAGLLRRERRTILGWIGASASRCRALQDRLKSGDNTRPPTEAIGELVGLRSMILHVPLDEDREAAA